MTEAHSPHGSPSWGVRSRWVSRDSVAPERRPARRFPPALARPRLAGQKRPIGADREPSRPGKRVSRDLRYDPTRAWLPLLETIRRSPSTSVSKPTCRHPRDAGVAGEGKPASRTRNAGVRTRTARRSHTGAEPVCVVQYEVLAGRLRSAIPRSRAAPRCSTTALHGRRDPAVGLPRPVRRGRSLDPAPPLPGRAAALRRGAGRRRHLPTSRELPPGARSRCLSPRRGLAAHRPPSPSPVKPITVATLWLESGSSTAARRSAGTAWRLG